MLPPPGQSAKPVQGSPLFDPPAQKPAGSFGSSITHLWEPISVRQLSEQPSKFVVLPSSHSSPQAPSVEPLPQTESPAQLPLLHSSGASD